MKFLPLSGLIGSLVYASFMLYRIPTIADSLIVLALSMVSLGYFYIISNKKQELLDSPEAKAIKELEVQLEKERLQENLEALKYEAKRRKAQRDEANAKGLKERGIFF